MQAPHKRPASAIKKNGENGTPGLGKPQNLQVKRRKTSTTPASALPQNRTPLEQAKTHTSSKRKVIYSFAITLAISPLSTFLWKLFSHFSILYYQQSVSTPRETPTQSRVDSKKTRKDSSTPSARPTPGSSKKIRQPAQSGSSAPSKRLKTPVSSNRPEERKNVLQKIIASYPSAPSLSSAKVQSNLQQTPRETEKETQTIEPVSNDPPIPHPISQPYAQEPLIEIDRQTTTSQEPPPGTSPLSISLSLSSLPSSEGPLSPKSTKPLSPRGRIPLAATNKVLVLLKTKQQIGVMLRFSLFKPI